MVSDKIMDESEAMGMPTLSMFFGILIRMFHEDDVAYHIPHFHAEYNEYEAAFDFEGNLLAGDMPKRQQKLILAWAELHKDELQANWKLLCENEPFFKIDPLR